MLIEEPDTDSADFDDCLGRLEVDADDIVSGPGVGPRPQVVAGPRLDALKPETRSTGPIRPAAGPHHLGLPAARVCERAHVAIRQTVRFVGHRQARPHPPAQRREVDLKAVPDGNTERLAIREAEAVDGAHPVQCGESGVRIATGPMGEGDSPDRGRRVQCDGARLPALKAQDACAAVLLRGQERQPSCQDLSSPGRSVGKIDLVALTAASTSDGRS
ncbi:hypothetical protein GCM10009560_50270 [Nonomuraea longicatena]|uniref:Uncharacterized protein n=1 Tax=Nonomuraea longicatena TaxID=83682 RepID=A0ABP4APH2_9ACTN